METKEEKNDQLFCLMYEVSTMKNYLLQNKLERWLPGFTDPETDFDHRQRYDWVCGLVENKSVLDMACGAGMGSYMMATNGKAKSVLGCDIDPEALRYASVKFSNANLRYEKQDATDFKGSELFDVVVSFETVEHIPATGLYLETVNNRLNADGLFIVSTPISALDEDLHPRNSFHCIEWGFRKFQDVVSTKFVIQKIVIQLHSPIPYSIWDRIRNKINPDAFKKSNTILEEFKKQFPTSKFGKSLRGYQILICKKK